MGIDARILIRGVKRSTVTDEWLKRVSWDLVSAFDHSNFWIQDGLPPVEFRDAERAWLKAFDAHPLAERYRDANGPNGRDYYRRPWFGSGDDTPKPPPCGMCPGGVYSGDRYGAGGNYAAYSCPGCGKAVETHDGGVTWENARDES